MPSYQRILFLTAFFFRLATAAAGPAPAAYITIADPGGTVLLETGLAVHAGDVYIGEDDRRFEVVSVHGTKATARLRQEEPDVQAAAAPAAPAVPLIAVYHTHTDESYIPSNRTATRPGDGSILEVGDVFAAKARELGYKVLHDQTRHDPHDANAYHRSRRTMARLLRQGPTALFDFHRDSAPLHLYRTTIGGRSAARLLLVVGRQNQNRRSTERYAKKIKAAADQKYKGLIRGIFIAKGNYNQDLSARAILVEVGTQYNTLADARYSAALLASVLPGFIPRPAAAAGIRPAPAPPPAESPPPDEAPAAADGRAAYADLLKLLALAAAGAAVYGLVAAQNGAERRRKLRRFFRFEFRDLFRGKRK